MPAWCGECLSWFYWLCAFEVPRRRGLIKYPSPPGRIHPEVWKSRTLNLFGKADQVQNANSSWIFGQVQI
jgi:hypothetical protein